MTMVDGGPQLGSSVEDGASWHMVDKDFWVGNTQGVFLGTIERHDPDRFFARNAKRDYVGEFASLAIATAAVEAQFTA